MEFFNVEMNKNELENYIGYLAVLEYDQEEKVKELRQLKPTLKSRLLNLKDKIINFGKKVVGLNK
jgi:hypothetical protein